MTRWGRRRRPFESQGGLLRPSIERDAALKSELWRFTWPALLGGLTVPLVGLCDTTIAGHLGHPRALAALGIAATAFDLLFFLFSPLRMGTTGLSAQAEGAGDREAQAAVLLRASLLALTIGFGLTAASAPLSAAVLMPFGASDAVSRAAELYLSARLLGAPAALLNYAILGWLIGAQRPQLVMGAQLTLNGLNVGLSIFFANQLDLGLWGIGAASALAQLMVTVTLVLLTREAYLNRPAWAALPQRRAWSALFVLSGDLMLRTLALMSAFALFQRMSARQGTEILAVNSALLQLQHLQSYALDGFAHGVEALVGAALGAGKSSQLRPLIRVATKLSAYTALAIAVAYFLAGDWIISLLTDLPAVRESAAVYLPWAALSPLLSVWPFLLDGVFIGAARADILRRGMLISLILFLCSAAILTPLAANHGLWAALMIFMIARGVTLYGPLRRLLGEPS